MFNPCLFRTHFFHGEMGDSDGCRGNGDSAKPFPFAANQEEEEGEGGSGKGVGGPWEIEVVTKSFTQSRGASGMVGGTSCFPAAGFTDDGEWFRMWIIGGIMGPLEFFSLYRAADWFWLAVM